MASRVTPMRFGEVDLLVETIPLSGTEPTSAWESTGERVLDVLDRTELAVEQIALSTARMIHNLSSHVRPPDQYEIELGLSFTAKGNVVVVGSEAGAQSDSEIELWT